MQNPSKSAVKKEKDTRTPVKCTWLPCFVLGNRTSHSKNAVMTDILTKVCIKLLLSSESAPTESGGSQKHNCRKCNFGTFAANILTIS